MSKLEGTIRGNQLRGLVDTEGLQAELDAVANNNYGVGVSVGRNRDTGALERINYSIEYYGEEEPDVAAIESAIKAHQAKTGQDDATRAAAIESANEAKASMLADLENTIANLEARLTALER